MMKRREFLVSTASVTAAVGATGFVGASCGGLVAGGVLGGGEPPLPPMDGFLAELDAGLAELDGWSLSAELTGDQAGHEVADDLARRTLRSLHLAGKLGDLPEAGQVHPGMQARIAAAQPEMDSAVFGMAAHLERLPDAEADALQQYLNRDDNPGMEIAAWLEEKERRIGVSPKRRLQSRAMLTQLVAELKSRPPRDVFGHYVGKVRKLAATTGGSAREIERRVAARMTREVFFAKQERLTRYAQLWADAGVTADGRAAPGRADVGGAGADSEPDAGAGSEEPAAEEAQGRMTLADYDAAQTALYDRYVRGEIDRGEYQRELNELAWRYRGKPAPRQAGSKASSPVPARQGEWKPYYYSAASETSAPSRSKADSVVAIGGWVLGIGIVSLAVGLPVAFIGDIAPLFIGGILATIGALMILAGLITLVAGVTLRNRTSS